MTRHTQVAIIGAGPAGSLLAHLLHRAQIDTVVLDRASRTHVLERIRAGVLEWGSVEVLRSAGLGDRMDAEGHVHDGASLVWGGREPFFVDINEHVGSHFMSYGQTRLQEDLYRAADERGTTFVFDVDDVEVHDVVGDRPSISFSSNGRPLDPQTSRSWTTTERT